MNTPSSSASPDALVRTISLHLLDPAFAPGSATDIWHEFVSLVNRVPGLSVLSVCWHLFPGGGISGLVLIGESHAAIHTWPEENRAWVELATCGDPTSLEVFQLEVLSVWNLDPRPSVSPCRGW